MQHYYNEESMALVVDLRDCDTVERYEYEELIERSKLKSIESYETNLYHIQIEDDEEGIKVSKLQDDLDRLEWEIEMSCN